MVKWVLPDFAFFDLSIQIIELDHIRYMKSQPRSRTTNKIDIKPASLPITIYPREVIFQDIQSHSCYEIILFIRNQSKQMEKIRVIEPTSKLFKVKTDENFTKALAPGLTIKLNVFFMSERIGEINCFQDQIFIYGNSFKELVTLRAFPPREKLTIPNVWNLGRLIILRDNLAAVPIKNQGKRGGKVKCEINPNAIVSLITKEVSIETGESKNVELKLKSKKIGNFQETLSFSNGAKCQLKGIFVEESVDILNSDGQRLNLIDLGQILIGERAEQTFHVLNNTENPIDCIFKTFNKNVEVNQLKMDTERGNFIIKSVPQEYAKQLKNCYAAPEHDKCKIGRFQEFQNKLIVNRSPDIKEQRLFQSYANGQVSRQIIQQPIIEALVIKLSNSKNYVKVPIKFISVFPRVKVSDSVVQFGDIKERTDNVKEISIQNQGERDIHLYYENSEALRIQTNQVLRARSTQLIKVTLRAVKAGSISEVAKIKLFEGLSLEIKVFACCRSSSIRAKKITNLNSSRQLTKGLPLYQTLASSGSYSRGNMSDFFNKTDVLGDIRTARQNKLLKEHIQSEKEPTLNEPSLNLRFQSLDNRVKSNPFMRKLKKDTNTAKLSLKEQLKYAVPLKTDQLSKIIIKQAQVSFGNVFINTEMTREVKVINNNSQPILFQWDFGNNECLKNTNSQMTKIQAQSQKTFKIIFNPNSLGAISLPLQYIINRNHIFQITLTAYVTLINVDISTKNLEYCFASLENVFEKSQEFQLANKSDTGIKCQLKFQENKHFHVESDMLVLAPKSQQKVTVVYKPAEGQELGSERVDTDKLIVRVVGGAQNTIKCSGTVNDAKVTLKESQITHSNILVSTPFTGKFNIKNHSKLQTIMKIQVGSELNGIVTFDKQLIILNGQEKKEINYTMICHQPKKINSFIYLHVRGSKTLKISVDVNIIFPEIVSSRDVIDFGNIPIMGNNYQETLTLTNLYKQQIRLEFSKKFQNEDYTIQIKEIFKPKTEQSLVDVDARLKKKPSGLKDQAKRNGNQKIFRLLPNVQVCLDVKFIPKKLQQFDIRIPLKLSGTNQFIVQPIRTRLICCGIEPVVYLQPHNIAFDTRILGEGKSCFMRSFEIRNPHEFDIDWFIQPQQTYKTECFYLSEDKGRLSAKESVHIEVMFKPQQEGHFFERMDVVLKEKKVSHISLELEGTAILPSIKFNCNELLMPVVPLGVESKAAIILQNHGYDAITISKWKTTTHFQSVQINVNFVQGKLLSLAKKHMKVEVTVMSDYPISFTTFLQFYDEFGNKYEVPLSCTIDNSIMTAFPYIQAQKSTVYLDKKDNIVKISSKSTANYQKDGGISAGQTVSCQFIKNWLNYQINLCIKKFPQCIVQSQGELVYRMINRISGLELVKRFQSSSNSDTFYNSIYAYYSQCIKVLKVQGAFLNQIRPEFLLSYKDYKAYLYSKNAIVEQQSNFQVLSVNAWIAFFYQLAKLYVLPHINQKMVSKYGSTSHAVTSVFYSPSELLVFKFLNAFNNDEFFFDFGQQIKFFEIFQHAFEKILGLNFTNSLMSLKISSVVMAPTLYLVLISKFLFEKLREYGLCQFLTETDLYSLGAKEMMLTMIHFIGMLYHYSNSINVCFQASIGDKITKIIEIQNPVSRKAKYRLKILGSEEFQLENQEIILPSRGKCQAKVSYHCKQNKPEEAKLLLIPVKQDNSSSIAQPMSFKLTTSILSKITLKKLQITAHLYQITTISLQVQLPMDIIDICEFSVSLNQGQEPIKSFHCFSQLNRTLRNNHDKLDIKLVPLTLQTKFCRVCYRSSTYGQFNFQITAKIETSPCIKEIKLKQLKVNKEEIVSINIPRENEQLVQALRFLNDHHVKLDYMTTTKKTIPLNKYYLSIVESSYISILDQYTEIPKASLDGKDGIRVDLLCSFGKPFNEYTCTMMIKNDILKDIRFYKLVTSVAMRPRIVPISVRTRAQETATVKIPIKVAPCDCYIENPIEQFTISNFNPHIKQSTDFTGVFSPDWIMDKEVNIIAENHETLEQVIYCISLKADEPAFFDSVKLEGSNVFNKKVRIPISIPVTQDLRVETTSKRLMIEDNKVTPQRKYINAVILPSNEQDMGNIKLINQKNGHYQWASLFITNKKVMKSLNVAMQQKPNNTCKYLIEQLPLGSDHQINFQPTNAINYQVVSKNGGKYLELAFSPQKEMEICNRLYVMVGGNQYVVNLCCKAPALPIVTFPEMYSHNLAEKCSSLILMNPCDSKGLYRAKIQPSEVFSLDCYEIQLKGKQKREIKIYFTPISLQTRYKAILKFQCDNLPTYEYHLNAISQFDSCQKTLQCEIYNDQEILTDIQFTNHFAKTEEFTIDQKFQLTPFQLVEPTTNSFKLQAGCTKKLIIKSIKCDRNVLQEGVLDIKLGERKWRYRLLPIVIKAFTTKKFNWHCKARETYYENIELPQKISLKSIESPPQISPYLTYTIQEGTNNLKIKYNPLKPLPKEQYKIFLLADKSKYVINCVVNVTEPDFDDTILIKTKEINEVGCVMFKLTNIKKVSVPFKVYFMKGQPDLSVQTDKNILEAYGRPGTVIRLKFTSNVYNKRVQDELWVQTSQMLWRFKVKGILSKRIQQK